MIAPTELAKLLGISKQRVYVLIAEGKLPKPRKFDGRRPASLLRDALKILKRRHRPLPQFGPGSLVKFAAVSATHAAPLDLKTKARQV